MVVLATIMPSTRRERAMCTTSSSSLRLRSGAIFSSTGESPAFAAPVRARRSLGQEIVECRRLLQIAQAGVFGDETLTVK